MKLAIVGSRSFNDYSLLEKTMAEKFKVSDIELVVSGGATGADLLGEAWAKTNGIPVKIFYPDWANKGRAAGYARNVEIIKAADEVIVFFDGVSKRSQHSIDIAEKQGKPCHVVKFTPKRPVALYTE